jgi:thiol-disulfide isomerase/thioredoxin
VCGVAQVGQPAPAFVLQSADSRQLTLHSWGPKPLVINVFASWCPPCRQELPRIVAAAHAHHAAVAFLGVDEQEPVEIGTRFAALLKIPYAVGFDPGQFAASYGAHALPETIFIRADGTAARFTTARSRAPDRGAGDSALTGFAGSPGRQRRSRMDFETTTASRRLLTLSLRRIAEMCALTVNSSTLRSAAI